MISVNHITRVISIPKADLTLIQTVPTEIRELDLGLFKLWMRDWEDGESGMSMPPVISHNTEVTVGGLTLARVIEIINGYTVTFENGAYAVNLVNANSNVGDVVNVNNVSVRANNSAGLVNIRAMEFPAYMSGIAVDTVNGVAGALYPTGTHAQPSNNMADALMIAQVRGVETFMVHGSLTLSTGDDVSGYKIAGESVLTTFLTIEAGAIVDNCQIEDAFVMGSVLDNYCYLKHCYVSGVSGLGGFIEGSILAGSIAPSGVNDLFIIDCKSGATGTVSPTMPVFDFTGLTGAKLIFRNWAGPLEIINSTDAGNIVVLDINSAAHLKTGVSNTAGTVYVRGICSIDDTSTMTIDTTTQIDKAGIGTAVYEKAQATPLYADTRRMNGATILGTGTSLDKWRG